MIAAKSLLVTPSILDSYTWLTTCPASWKEKAEAEFSNSLNRIYTDLSPEIRRGMDFEDKICRDVYISRELFIEKHGKMLSEFYAMCKGGAQQAVLKTTIKVDDQDYLLYGKADILFMPMGATAGHILDIKTTGKFKGPQYYTGRAQHLLYIVASGIERFTYLVAVGKDVEGKAWEVDSVLPIDASTNYEEALVRLQSKIRDFVAFLQKRPELLTAYVEVFTR